MSDKHKKKDLDNESYFEAALAGGKLPPQAPDLEEAVLGALMLEQRQANIVISILRPEMFYVTAHQLIYAAILKLHLSSSPIDILTVTDELRKGEQLDKVGGAYYISKLTNRVTSAANIEYHARIVIQKFMSREIIKITNSASTEAYQTDTDPFSLITDIGKSILDVQTKSVIRGMRSTDDILLKTIAKIEGYNPNSPISGVPSGFTKVDNKTLGWQGSDLIILAARPAMGKSALAFDMFRNAVLDYKKHGLFASLEMSAEQLMQRAISGESGVEQERIKRGDLTKEDWANINEATNKLSNERLNIMDVPGLSVSHLRAQAIALKMEKGLDFIIVDYLQLMRPENEKANRDVQIGQISRDLKQLAMELDIPVIALAQLSREVEKRPDKKPMLSDLRESGNIEQDADMVCFLMRWEYYKSHEKVMFDNQEYAPYGLAYFEIAKYRNGSIGKCLLYFDKKTVSFGNYLANG